MNTIPVGAFKSQLSNILTQIEQGKRFCLTFGRKKKKIAVLIPYSAYMHETTTRKLGLLEHKGPAILHEDFKMTDEEFLSS